MIDQNTKGNGFTPIGISSNLAFKGTFDGNDKQIGNIFVSNTTQNYEGLFGYLNNATIKDLNLDTPIIRGNNNIGTLVGYANNTNITNINASNITTGTLSGNRITGGVIEGVTLKTVEPSTSGGVWIKKDGLQLGSTTFHYVDGKFKVEATQNISISTMNEIHIMAGLKSNGTPDTSKERLINLSGKVTCDSLYVNGVQITGNGGVAVFG